jgi:hypothetical protein
MKIHESAGHYWEMIIFMILAGILTTMNVWANSIRDIRLSLNDVYMIALMTGWMILFMSLWRRNYTISFISTILVATSLYCIRTQAFITEHQFIKGMIPHHSMAIHMANKLSENPPPRLSKLLESIIKSQQEEINYMKSLE